MKPLCLPVLLLLASRSWCQEGLEDNGQSNLVGLSFTGKIELDSTAFSPNSELSSSYKLEDDNLEIRRMRLSASGITEEFRFRSTLDFSDQGFRDLYLELQEWDGPGKLRIGHFREPILFEAMTSADNILFMERSQAVDLSPGRNLGLMAHDISGQQSLSWSLGAFYSTESPVLDFKSGGASALAMTGRLHWHSEGQFGFGNWQSGNLQASSGVAASLRFPHDNTYSFTVGGEISSAPALLSTGPVVADSVRQLSAEMAIVDGPFTALAEAILSNDSGGDDEHSFFAASAQLGWVLVGAGRRIIPGRVSFDSPGGGGDSDRHTVVWEVAARSSWADLNSRNIQAGIATVDTLALSAHLSPQVVVRVEWNRVNVEETGSADVFQARVHVGF
ncbi:MAG: hypothetical protein COB96_00475 [Planctomycetota bacterium]|nr:MAG: hypothetical protein COB96_00475 [Planctomycetota bacterium]